MEKIPLQKYIALCGISSRRKAADLIKENKILINNKPASLADKVNFNDKVTFKGKIIKPVTSKIYILLNKPEGFVVTRRRFRGEHNVFELIKTKQLLHPVGRLDKNSCGLLLLTNDGELTNRLTHPRYQHPKEYEVTLYQKISPFLLKKLKGKIKIFNESKNQYIFVQAKKVRLLSSFKIQITIPEGKKRQIRKMFAALGLKIKKLKRTKIGSLSLGNLPPGQWRYLKKEEIKQLFKG